MWLVLNRWTNLSVAYCRMVSWDLTGTRHSEIAVELELSWLSDRNDHIGLVYVLPAPPC